MANIKVVIGAGFGDEGKGLMTDCLASTLGKDAVVVRFNGGSQAGHTVVTPEGHRHVFGHFGSGSFVGCSTHLSKYFICNPMEFIKEREILLKYGLTPEVTISPKSIITTPWDMLINQIKESNRGKEKHGSCGLGINETIQRNNDIKLTYDNLFTMDKYERSIIIGDIYNYYYDKINEMFSIKGWHKKFMDNINIVTKFCDDVNIFMDQTDIMDDKALKHYDNIIFEGAQGLMLDQDHPNFPHVTHSKTGLHNVANILRDAKIDKEVDVYYMIRAYLTRHGAGPMPNECDKPYDTVYDETNVPNEWQDSLRYGLLDIDTLIAEIIKDSALYDVNKNIVVTCMDQVPDLFQIYKDGKILCTSKKTLINDLFNQFFENGDKLEHVLTSSGNTRDKVIVGL